MSFENQTVWITGAAGHLGRTVAAAFAEQGARLVLLDRAREPLEALARAVPGSIAVPVDLLDGDRTLAATDAALQQVSTADVLCHLTGGFRMGEAVHETTDAIWDFLFDLNARTLVNVARSLVPRMIEQGHGRIVTVGAHAARTGVAQMGVYCASKSSVIRLTEAMSAELKDSGINVNCVLPSIIDTPDNRAAMPAADFDRWVSPRALADVILFLASSAATSIHGAAIPVTGLLQAARDRQVVSATVGNQLLALHEDGTYRRIHAKWFGGE